MYVCTQKQWQNTTLETFAKVRQQLKVIKYMYLNIVVNVDTKTREWRTYLHVQRPITAYNNMLWSYVTISKTALCFHQLVRK